jgi:hypothetical protein
MQNTAERSGQKFAQKVSPFMKIMFIMGCGGRPNHRHHYLKRVPAATTPDNTITYFYHLIYSTTLQHYNTTTQYINPDTCTVQWNKLVHKTMIHKALPKNYHEESLITFSCRIYISFYYPTNQFGTRTY